MISMFMLLSPEWMNDVDTSEQIVLIVLGCTTFILAVVAMKAIYTRWINSSSGVVIV